MVANNATTPASHATGCLSASALLSPLPSAAPSASDPLWVSAPSASPSPNRAAPVNEWTSSSTLAWHSDPTQSLAPLIPPPSLTDKILDDLASPQFSLAVVAQMHGLSLAGLLTWLNLPETREQLALRESAAYAHARHVAAINMEQAVQTAASIVREYNTSRSQRETQDRATPGTAHRASIHARKAAWLLYRFSRILPVNEADLRRATGYVVAGSASANGTSRRHGTASVNERTSPSASPRVACLLEEQACSDEHAASSSPAVASVPSSSELSPLRRSDRCHGFQPVESGPTPTSTSCSSPPLGRTSSSTPDAKASHGCPADGAPMPPDQPDSAPSPCVPTPLRPSAPFTLPPPRHSVVLRGEPLPPRNSSPSAAFAFSSPSAPLPRARDHPA